MQTTDSAFDGWESVRLRAKTSSFESKEVIYLCESAATRLFRVEEGYVKISRYLPDGRCQILQFCGPGDYFGLEASGTDRVGQAEALCITSVTSVDHGEISRAADTDARIAAWHFSLLLAEIRRAQDLILTLGQMNANEKIDYFLTHVVGGSAGNDIYLPMNMTDIGDFLGLRIETVSRTMTKMKRLGVIRKVRGATHYLYCRSETELERLVA